MGTELPLLWGEVLLGEVSEIVGGGTPNTGTPHFFDGDIPWVTPTDVTSLDSLYIHDTAKHITKDGLDNSSARLLPAGSVLLTSRATIGRAVISTKPMATNQGFANLICDTSIIQNEFLALLLEARREYLISRAGGTTFKEISKSTLAKIKIPLPPLPEQQFIVDILKKTDELRRCRRDAFELAGNVRAKLFLEMFGDPSEYSGKWKVVPFEQLVTYSKYGPRFPNREYTGDGARILRTTDMEGDGSIRWWESPVLSLSEE